MKKLIAILTACACALAVIAHAAKPDQGEAKADKKSAPKSKAVAPKTQAPPKQKVAPPPRQQSVPKTNVQSKVPKKERTAPAVESKTDASVSNVESKKVKPDKAPKLQTDKADKAPDAANVVADDKLRKNAKATTAKINKLDPAAVKKIQAQHTTFQAKPKTAISSVQFDSNYRIAAAQNWTGPQYEVFRSYQPQWHDRSWWSSRYTTLSLIAGGWYFWDAGYWYPAWGYDDSAAYYPYDGPIYVGSNPRPFDQVVADVQAVLQEQGYYTGEVDGLIGPLTRDALAAYQQAAGLPPTASVDQPTLESLGLS
jgi:hypothetical protein